MENDESITAAALGSLDERAHEPDVARMLVEFEGWKRPRTQDD
jgi:hypothetical protein